ncbi:uncharacterized protein A4U43_C09F7500 [Asparagus officinalis]|uniref:Uncharacterized protein n=1 Tax=Asparagus officinalis TaxID=4686 RepID=A0A5P1E7P6_ASPOF|nr:uncharacterized protein A4U43_C09F7500 [Asparagus officinalis]
MLLDLWTACLCRPLVFGCVFLWLAFGTACPLFQLCFFVLSLVATLNLVCGWSLAFGCVGLPSSLGCVGLWLAFVSVVYFVQPLVAFLGGSLLFLGIWLCWPLVFGCVGLCLLFLGIWLCWPLVFGCVGLCLDLVYDWSLAFGCVSLRLLLLGIWLCWPLAALGFLCLLFLGVWLCWPLVFGCVGLCLLLLGIWLCWPIAALAFLCLLLLGIWLCWPLGALDFMLSLVAASCCLGFGCVGLLLVLCLVSYAMVGLWFHVDAGLCFNFVHGFNLLSALVSALGWPLVDDILMPSWFDIHDIPITVESPKDEKGVLEAVQNVHGLIDKEDDEEEGEEGEEEGLSKCIGKELKKLLQCHSHCK